MMTQTEVKRESPDKLSRQCWFFQFDDQHGRLQLSGYLELSRPSRRHSYQVARGYYWSDHRNDTIALEDIPLPPEIAAEAKLLFCESITVTK